MALRATKDTQRPPVTKSGLPGLARPAHVFYLAHKGYLVNLKALPTFESQGSHIKVQISNFQGFVFFLNVRWSSALAFPHVNNWLARRRDCPLHLDPTRVPLRSHPNHLPRLPARQPPSALALSPKTWSNQLVLQLRSRRLRGRSVLGWRGRQLPILSLLQ